MALIFHRLTPGYMLAQDNATVVAECMRHITLRGLRIPTVEYAVCIYIYLFIGLSGFMVQSSVVLVIGDSFSLVLV